MYQIPLWFPHISFTLNNTSQNDPETEQKEQQVNYENWKRGEEEENKKTRQMQMCKMKNIRKGNRAKSTRIDAYLKTHFNCNTQIFIQKFTICSVLHFPHETDLFF